MTSLFTSPRIENYHVTITVLKMGSNHHVSHKSSVHKQQVQPGTFPSWTPHQMCHEVIFHTLQELAALFLL